jgi:hypothetical protein
MTLKTIAKQIPQLSAEQFLDAVGLQRTKSPAAKVFGRVGLVGLGALIGAGATLALALMMGAEVDPRISGRESTQS